MEKTEFEFPHETEEKASRLGSKVVTPEAEADIEVVDDTPVEDRNRALMTEAPTDPTDEELESYTESAKKRLKHFTKGYHEERRAKETAIREREEAIRAAQVIFDENKKLKGSLNQGQQALLEQAKKVVANELTQAKQQYKTAYEAGDVDALVEAQENMTTVKLRAERVNNFRPAPVKEDAPVAEIPQPAPIDEKAVAWRQNNDWFGSDDEMTSFALGLHNKLIKDGVDPRSNEYYDKVNARVRQVFPEKFDSEETADASTQRTTKRNVVAPATRSTAPRKVVLSQSQVNIAKRLGVPLELYARKVAEEMRK